MQGGDIVDKFQKGMFDKIQQNTNINPADIYKVADSVKSANLSDEKTVRNLVRQLAAMANKPVSKQLEDKIVKAIINKKIPADPNSLNQFFKN